MNFNIITLGCKVNQYESQAMREDLIRHGYSACSAQEKADIIIINSCTVTSVSDAKNRKLISRFRRENPNAVIVLTGCMPQAFPDETDNFKNCDIVLGNARRAELIPSIERFLSQRERFVSVTAHEGKYEPFESMQVSSFDEHTRAFVKIEDGCNRFCSYCIIPYARGRVRSKSLDELKTELEALALRGYKEIVLVGINLSAYGLGEDYNLADAVECACGVVGVERVRLGSIEPEQMDGELISRLAAQPKLCPQFHLSLQSGCDKTLRAMNRHYNSAEYLEIVNNLRAAFKNSSMTTDVMVGFAGETEEDFADSMSFVEKVGFAKVHVFPYSQRKGTVAANAPDQVSPAEKDRRAALMGSLVEESRFEFLKAQVGLTEEVLFERLRNGFLEGYTKNYTPVKVLSDNSDLCGKIYKVKLTRAHADYCEGAVVD